MAEASCLCPEGTFEDVRSTSCIFCTRCMNHEGFGAVPKAHFGYYLTTAINGVPSVFQCFGHERRCPEGSEESCAAGRRISVAWIASQARFGYRRRFILRLGVPCNLSIWGQILRIYSKNTRAAARRVVARFVLLCNKFEKIRPRVENPKKPLIEEYIFAYP